MRGRRGRREGEWSEREEGQGAGTFFGRVFLENIGVSLEQKRNFQNLNCLS